MRVSLRLQGEQQVVTPSLGKQTQLLVVEGLLQCTWVSERADFIRQVGGATWQLPKLCEKLACQGRDTAAEGGGRHTACLHDARQPSYKHLQSTNRAVACGPGRHVRLPAGQPPRVARTLLGYQALTVFCEGAVTLNAAAGELSCRKLPPCTDPTLLSTLVMMGLYANRTGWKGRPSTPKSPFAFCTWTCSSNQHQCAKQLFSV